MPFDLDGHPLLTTDFADLGREVKEEHVALAADILGLADHESLILGSTQEGKALRALAIQCNFQVEGGVEADLLKSEEVDDYQRDYSGATVSPRAAVLASQVVESLEAVEDWPIIRSRY